MENLSQEKLAVMKISTKDLDEALNILQTEIPPIKRTETANITSSRSYDYAALDTVWVAIQPSLKKLGLTMGERTYYDNFIPSWVCEISVTHAKTGQMKSTTKPIFLPPEEYEITDNSGVVKKFRPNLNHAFGAGETYMKRYGILGLLGLVTEEDDDANSATPHSSGGSSSGHSHNAPSGGAREPIYLKWLAECKDLRDFQSKCDYYAKADKYKVEWAEVSVKHKDKIDALRANLAPSAPLKTISPANPAYGKK